MTLRNTEPVDPRERYSLMRLCDCPTCEGRGQVIDYANPPKDERCPDCRGEGRVRQEGASCESPEAVGVALVTLAREGEFEECQFGLLDRMPPCDNCGGYGEDMNWYTGAAVVCHTCKGSGVKPTGTWLILPWPTTARTASAAGKLLRSRR